MPLPPSIVLHSSLRCLHMITFNHQVLPCQQQLRHYAGQNIKWRVFVVAVVVIRDIVATSCRDRRGGWRGSAQRGGGSPGRAEGDVGGTVSGDGRWSLA